MIRAAKTLLIAVVMLAAPASKAQEFRTIATEELARKLAAREVVLIDARSEVEFGEVHIAGAVLVPARLVATKLPAVVKERSTPVVFYCNGPNCTKTLKAAKAAKAIGYTNVLEYKEGLPGWAKSGRKTEGRPLPASDAPTIAAAELKRLLGGAGAPIVVDIRDAEEFARFHIAEAIGVPLDELAAWADRAPAGRAVVLVDHAGHQTPVAARVLRSRGRDDVRRLDGGVLRWQASGLPVVAAK